MTPSHSTAAPLAGVAAGGPLDNYANNADTPPSARSHRWRRLRLLWRLSSLERVRKCGRVRHTPHVGLRLTGGRAGLAGLTSCGSVWACPRCNSRIMAVRALEVGAGVALWLAQGGSMALLTVTARHHRGQRLAALWAGIAKAWRSVLDGNAGKAIRRDHGIAGIIKATEVTHGRRNGWHPHFHLLVFLDRPTDLTALHSRIFARWDRALVRLGFAAPLMVGQDIREVKDGADLACYLTKATDDPRRLGLELTHSQGKLARSALSTRTPWELLDDVEAGDADALDLWNEYELASKGKRQITWSRGLRDRLALLDAERSDDDIAADEVGTDADTLFWITADGWDQLIRNAELIPQLLDLTESGGLTAARGFLDLHHVEYALEREGVNTNG